MTTIKAYAAVLAAAISLFATAPAAMAQSTVYDCRMSSLEGRGFIRPAIKFSIDFDKGEAAVVDDVVMRRYGKPIPATLTQLGNGQYRLKWEVKNVRNGSASFDLAYTLQYRPKVNAFNIRAQVRGYDNRPFGTGSCAISAGASLLG
ncbi:hypothetical protein [uncultured Tateyamaria sp.]|uniref:hypothetical protein n=1 Tax=uncultured Tateyamaria sp. TaxID=455651 RepID=UPI00260C08CD|nr:hypothetical protein [uncultured Tateyamaria sp.]